MSVFLDCITAFGTFVAAVSVVSVFVLYKIQKRDEYLSEVRKSLQMLSNGMDELDELLNFELAYELASALVYSKSTEYCIQQVFKICNDATVNGESKDKVQVQIKDTLGVFGISFQNVLVSKYGERISSITQCSTVFYPDYKGLFRFSKACTTLMRNVFTNYKKLLLDEDLLAKLISDKMIQANKPWDSYEHFQKELLDHLISIVELSRIHHSQKDIDCLLKLVEIVYSCHIELSAKEWRQLARKSKKVVLQPYSVITTVTEDLREAEKCFQSIMSHDSIMKYASLVQTIEISNSDLD